MATLKEELEGLIKKVEDEERDEEERRTIALAARAEDVFKRLIVGIPNLLREVASRGEKTCIPFSQLSASYCDALKDSRSSFVFSNDKVFDALAVEFEDWCNSEDFTCELLDAHNVGGALCKAIRITFAK